MKWMFLITVCMSLLSCGQNGDRYKGKFKVPVFNLLLLDSATVFNTAELSKSDPIVFVLFDPYCEHCQEETGSIIKKIKVFKNTQFCFLTTASISDARNFSKNFEMEKYKNIRIGIDTGRFYTTYFNARGVPHISIYGKGGVLKYVFPNQVNADDILAVLND